MKPENGVSLCDCRERASTVYWSTERWSKQLLCVCVCLSRDFLSVDSGERWHQQLSEFVFSRFTTSSVLLDASLRQTRLPVLMHEASEASTVASREGGGASCSDFPSFSRNFYSFAVAPPPPPVSHCASIRKCSDPSRGCFPLKGISSLLHLLKFQPCGHCASSF